MVELVNARQALRADRASGERRHDPVVRCHRACFRYGRSGRKQRLAAAKAEEERRAKEAEQQRLAAAKGDATAMNNLGELYYYGRDVAQDYAKAREWYKKAADKGNARAEARLKQLPVR